MVSINLLALKCHIMLSITDPVWFGYIRIVPFDVLVGPTIQFRVHFFVKLKVKITKLF